MGCQDSGKRFVSNPYLPYSTVMLDKDCPGCDECPCQGCKGTKLQHGEIRITNEEGTQIIKQTIPCEKCSMGGVGKS